MTLIGNRRDAEYAYELSENRFDYGEWAMVGGGSFRTVYRRGESDVVYKTEEAWRDRGYNNGTELRHAKALWRESVDGLLGKYLRIPRTSGFRINGQLILAMEYMQEDESLPDDRAYLALYNLHFADMHRYNYVHVDKRLAPIDMAAPRTIRTGGGDIRCLNGSSFYDIEYARRFGPRP